MSNSIRQRPSKALTGMCFALGLAMPALAAGATYEVKLYDTTTPIPNVVYEGSISYTNPRTGDIDTPVSGTDVSDMVRTAAGSTKFPERFDQDNSPTPDLKVSVVGSNDWTPDEPPANAGDPRYEDLTSPQGHNVEGLKGSLVGTMPDGVTKFIVTFDVTGTGPFYRTYTIRPLNGFVPTTSGKYSITNSVNSAPEPDSLALILVGLGAGAWLLRRRKLTTIRM